MKKDLHRAGGRFIVETSPDDAGLFTYQTFYSVYHICLTGYPLGYQNQNRKIP